MPTTRPGFIWSGTEWVAIGQEAVLAPVKYQATAPSSPATGDIWIESDVDVPSIDSAQFLRWRKTMTGGETSLSGNDDSSLPLAYTPGYEQLYINGVLQVRGQDYTATTGTTVTGLTALVANDVVEIFSAVARTVADVYTQTQSDARFVNKNVGGLNLVIPTSVSVGSGTGSISTNGAVSFSNASTVSINGCFSSNYENYKIFINLNAGMSLNAEFFFRFMTSGTPNSTNAYSYAGVYNAFGNPTSVAGLGASAVSGFRYFYSGDAGYIAKEITIFGPHNSANRTLASVLGTDPTANITTSGRFSDAVSFDGIHFYGGTASGTIRIYGYNNGA